MPGLPSGAGAIEGGGDGGGGSVGHVMGSRSGGSSASTDGAALALALATALGIGAAGAAALGAGSWSIVGCGGGALHAVIARLATTRGPIALGRRLRTGPEKQAILEATPGERPS